jgi:thiamine-phosphate pyrophosphorylase
MNDRPDIAQLVEADGVHLGQDDLDVSAARKILGSRAIIGVSTHSIDQLEKAILAGADYVGVGPTFPSQTKSFEEYPGLEFVRAASQLTTLPLFVIGGVNEKNISEVVKAGGKRVAVSYCVCQAEEPSKIIRELLIHLQT